MSFRPGAVAVVPALNEQETVASVVRTLVGSGLFGEVVVVDDGSDDRTSEEARAAGARVVRHDSRQGKGAAMATGVGETDSSAVCFFDADLKGLRMRHVRQVIEPVLSGKCGMSVGIVDRGPLANFLAQRLPLVSGQRAMLREVFLALPSERFEGYGIEIALNSVCRAAGHGVSVSILDGVSVRRKTEKVGLAAGTVQYFRMWFRVVQVWLGLRLEGEPFLNHVRNYGKR